MNTHPNTIFGKFFAKIGLWHPHFEGGITEIYEQLESSEQLAIQEASGLIAVINANLDATPDFIFEIIKLKFPEISKEKVTEVLSKATIALKLVEDNTPENFDDAIVELQVFLSKYEGSTWINATKFVVTELANVLTHRETPVEIIATVLDFVYRTFIKGKIA